MSKKWTPKIVMRDPATLMPYQRNTKIHTKAQVLKVANSIDKFGFTQPIVVDRDGVIVVGHCRREAAIQLNMKEVPVFVADHLTDDEVTALRITDNRIADAPWDADLLKFELTSLNMHEFDLDVLGFEMPELDKFLNDGEIGPELFGGSKVATGNEDKVDILPVTHIKENPNDADAVPEVTKFDFVKPGDIWTLGRHRLMCGDSTSKEDVAKLMNSSKSDMVFTDPPYGIKNDSAKGATYNNNKAYDDSITFDLKQLPFLDCDWVIWGGNYYNWLPKNRTEIGWVVWDKRPTRETWDEKTREAADRIFGQHFEIAVTNISGIRGKMIRKTWGGFYGTAGNPEDAIVHRTQKPIELITHFLKSEHKIILDYFGGSGSTLIACEKTNRNCFMMELDPHYCAVILRRFAEYTGNDPVRESDGALLSDLLLD